MSELSIKVNIANRTYPLSIQGEEEGSVTKAVKMLNDNLQKLEESYAVKDKQDLLAMTALEFATRLVEKTNLEDADEKARAMLASLESRVSEYLKG